MYNNKMQAPPGSIMLQPEAGFCFKGQRERWSEVSTEMPTFTFFRLVSPFVVYDCVSRACRAGVVCRACSTVVFKGAWGTADAVRRRLVLSAVG